MMGCLPFPVSWPGGVPCWLEKGQGRSRLCGGVVVVWCMLLGSRTARPLVGGGVPFPPSWSRPLWGGCLGWCGVVV